MKKIFKISGLMAIIFFVVVITSLCFVSTVNVNAYADSEGVYIGGTPIGIVAKGNALVVTELVDVVSAKGAYSPAMQAGIQKGDLIIMVNGEKVGDIIALNTLIAETESPITFSVKRNGQMMNIVVEPIFDLTQNANKIGMQVKGDLSGIGTLTYITKDYEFGALGHQIMDEYNYADIYQEGKIFECTIDGFIKGEEGKAGELRGKILYTDNSIGNIEKNSITGLFGTINEDQTEGRKLYPLGTKDDVSVGKAQIYTTIDQNPPQFYDIEIVKAEKQNSLQDKGMVIRITDDTLLEKTNGILQGMSGSPIIQNGKIIGAVTHVFISDPTMGYGVYIDWMINN
jgi:stage IV sporulation protein B